MARPGSCPTCSAKVPRDASYCASCGRSLGVEVELASFDEDEDLARQPVTVEPQQPHGLRNLLLAAGVVALLVGAAVLTGRDDRPDPTAAATTTTTTTTRAASSTSVARSTTTTQPALRTVELGRALLGEPTGVAVYALGDGQLARIEPDTGRVWLRRVDATGSEGGAQLLPVGGGVLVATPGNGSQLVSDQGGVPSVRLDEGWFELLPGPSPAELWRLSSDESNGQAATIQRRHMDGTPAGPELTLPPVQSVLVDGAGGVLLVAFGATYQLDAETGAVGQVLDGVAVGATQDRLVDLRCDDRLKCRWRVTERASGEQHVLAQPPSARALSALRYGRATVSPDGRWLSFDDLVGRLRVVDLEDGTERDVGAATGYCCQPVAAWSADGRWLFFPEGGGLRAWRAGSAEPVTLDVPDLPPVYAVAAGPLPAR